MPVFFEVERTDSNICRKTGALVGQGLHGREDGSSALRLDPWWLAQTPTEVLHQFNNTESQHRNLGMLILSFWGTASCPDSPLFFS